MPKLKKEKHISRMKNYARGKDAFWLRLYKGTHNYERGQHQRLAHSKVFSVAQYGTLTAALAAAVAYRDEYLKTNHPPRPSQKKKHYTRNSANNTGVIGVHRYANKDRERESYVATWVEHYPNGTRKDKQKHFSFHPTDFDGQNLAFKRAVTHRKAMLKQHYIEQL